MITRTLVQEIDDIRAGRWDNTIRTNLGLPSEENDTTQADATPATEAAVEKEEPAQLDMEIEEVAAVLEQADPVVEAVRLATMTADSLCVTSTHTATGRSYTITRSA